MLCSAGAQHWFSDMWCMCCNVSAHQCIMLASESVSMSFVGPDGQPKELCVLYVRQMDDNKLAQQDGNIIS